MMDNNNQISSPTIQLASEEDMSFNPAVYNSICYDTSVCATMMENPSSGPAPRFGLPKSVEILVAHLLLNIKKTVYKKNYAKSRLHCDFSLNYIKKNYTIKKIISVNNKKKKEKKKSHGLTPHVIFFSKQVTWCMTRLIFFFFFFRYRLIQTITQTHQRLTLVSRIFHISQLQITMHFFYFSNA
jgi:hypothetical protein